MARFELSMENVQTVRRAQVSEQKAAARSQHAMHFGQESSH